MTLAEFQVWRQRMGYSLAQALAVVGRGPGWIAAASRRNNVGRDVERICTLYDALPPERRPAPELSSELVVYDQASARIGAGEKIVDVARSLNLDYATLRIFVHADRPGFRKPRLKRRSAAEDPYLVVEIARRTKAGEKPKEIAEALGIHAISIGLVIRRYRLDEDSPDDNRRWTPREDELLRALLAAGLDAYHIGAGLLRSAHAVKLRARALEATPRTQRPWTPAELDTLQAMRREGKTRAQIAAALDRSMGAVKLKLAEIEADRIQRPWTAEDERVLREGVAAGESCGAVAARLSRTVAAVQARASALGLSFKSGIWTDERLARLAALRSEGRTIVEIAEALGLTPRQVKRKAIELRLHRPDAGIPWSDADIARLRELFESGMRPQRIAAEIGRSVPAVYTRLRMLGLAKKRRAPAA